MTAVAGKGGTVSYGGGNVATIDNWSADVTNDMLDVTSFTTSAPQWRSFISGLSSWTGSLSGVFDPASTGQDDLIANLLSPTTAALVLEMDQTAGGKLSGSALLSGGSFSVAIDGRVEVSWNFQGNGAPTYSTST